MAGFPPTPLSVYQYELYAKRTAAVNKNLSQKPREIVHLDNASLQNQSILKKAFQNQNFGAQVPSPFAVIHIDSYVQFPYYTYIYRTLRTTGNSMRRKE